MNENDRKAQCAEFIVNGYAFIFHDVKVFVEKLKTCNIAERIHKDGMKDGMEEMRLIVFCNVLRKGICESVAAEIAGIPIEEITKYHSLIQYCGES